MQYAMELVGHYTKPVERQVCEGVVIHSDPSDLVPAVARVAFSNAAGGREGGEEGEEGGGGHGLVEQEPQGYKQDPAETFLDASQCFG